MTDLTDEQPAGSMVSVIEVEKLLLLKLGREWTPTGISIVSLIDELSAQSKPAKPVSEALAELKAQVEGLRNCGQTLLDAINKEAKAQMTYDNALQNFSNPKPEGEALGNAQIALLKARDALAAAIAQEEGA